MIKKNVFGKAALTGLVLIAVSIWMMIVSRTIDSSGAWLPEGFKVPILALEFASGKAEMSRIIDSLSEEAVATLQWATMIDMLFLIVYNLFLAFVLTGIYKITGLRQYKLFSLLPVVIMLADNMENMQLFNAFDHIEVNILVLQISTWVKWLGLSIAFIAIGRFLITTGRYYDKVLALATFVTLPIGLYAMFSHNGVNEVFAALFYLLFPMTIMYCWLPGIKKAS